MTGRDLSRVSFLVVDDNEFSRSLVRTILTAFHVRDVVEAKDGVEAFDLLGKRLFDFVLCDYDMKPMSGLSFVRKIRSDPNSPAPNIPIIILSAYSNYDDVRATRDSGVNDYLIKPYSVRALAERILHVIDFPRPTVRSASYVGPDRRRRADPAYAGPFRRAGDRKLGDR